MLIVCPKCKCTKDAGRETFEQPTDGEYLYCIKCNSNSARGDWKEYLEPAKTTMTPDQWGIVLDVAVRAERVALENAAESRQKNDYMAETAWTNFSKTWFALRNEAKLRLSRK